MTIWARCPLKEGVEVTYAYKPDGLRLSKITNGVTTTHVWDGQNIVAELDGESVSAIYLRGINLIYAQKSGVKTFYNFNAHGDVVQLTNASGTVTKDYRYDAFGVEQEPDEGDANVWRYCGEYWDIETGTIYLRARYYDPVIGRFTQQDTTLARRKNVFDPYGGYQDTSLSGGAFRDQKKNQFIVNDPLSLNLYTYSQNNPLFFIDPTGHNIFALDPSLQQTLNGLLGVGALTGTGGLLALGIYDEYLKIQSQIQLTKKIWSLVPIAKNAKNAVGRIDSNKKNHILQGKHNWNKSVPNPGDPNNWKKIAVLIQTTITLGTSANYKDGNLIWSYLVNEQTVQVVTRVVKDILTIVDAWVKKS